MSIDLEAPLRVLVGAAVLLLFAAVLVLLGSLREVRFEGGLGGAVVLATVTEVETLATGISGKIWQKIVILDTVGRG